MSIFTKERVKKPRRSKKDMSFNQTLTTRFGALTPILCAEVYPNETWKENPQVLCRMTPLIAPLMSKMEIRTDYFFVPLRVLWADFEEFITRGIDGTTELELPTLPLRDLYPWNGSLADYLNLPTVAYPGSAEAIAQELAKEKWSEEVRVDPFLAYRKIYQDWYVDENLQPDEVDRIKFPVTTEEIQDQYFGVQISTLLSRGWKKDYFTACLPWAQRGPEVSMRTQIVGNGGVIGELYNNTVRTSEAVPSSGLEWVNNDNQNILTDVGSVDEENRDLYFGSDGVTRRVNLLGELDSPNIISKNGSLTGLEGEGFTINEFRRLYRLQLWFERNARAGGRYIESILAHFGKRVPDYRLDRSEYIGGVTNEFSFGEVLQTSSNNESTGQALASYAGRGISLLAGKIKKYHVDEHGWIIGILSIRPKRNAYFQGIPRAFSRKKALDFMFPLFTNLGEQEVLNKEIFLDDSEEVRNSPFGYNPRYAELYGSLDQVHGEMRNTLSFWHTARIFEEQPTLSPELVKVMGFSKQPLNRIFAFDDPEVYADIDSSNDHFILEVHQTIKAKRCLPKWPTPGL